MSTIIVMPLKMQSERVVSKNFKILDGTPLYQWALGQFPLLLREDVVDGVAIYGTEDVYRRVLDGFLTSRVRQEYESILQHFPEEDGEAKRDSNTFFNGMASYCKDYDWMIVRNCTSPFLKFSTLQSTLHRLQIEAYDSACTMRKLQGRFWRLIHGYPDPVNHIPDRCPRTQDQEPYYMESDAFWIFPPDLQLSWGRRVGHLPLFVPLQGIEALDIDTPEDWQLAEAAARYIVTLPEYDPQELSP